jgi:hypothetical protein
MQTVSFAAICVRSADLLLFYNVHSIKTPPHKKLLPAADLHFLPANG